MMFYQHCMRCGRILKPGDLKYLVSIKVLADFDGVINDIGEDARDLIGEVLQEMEGMDADDLEGDVYEELDLLLCKVCKDRFVRNPLNHHEDDLSFLDPDASTPIH